MLLRHLLGFQNKHPSDSDAAAAALPTNVATNACLQAYNSSTNTIHWLGSPANSFSQYGDLYNALSMLLIYAMSINCAKRMREGEDFLKDLDKGRGQGKFTSTILLNESWAYPGDLRINPK